MNITTTTSFWLNDLEKNRSASDCPIKGCGVAFIRPNAKNIPCCEKHGLEIHKNTFVYYNGETNADKSQARLRNSLPGGAQFLGKHILGNRNKAESHRLGYENSEDALSWNVFGELHRRGLIHLAYNYFTGKNLEAGRVRLFLWGLNIDFVGDEAEPWVCLKEVRDELEKGVKRFLTEPDIVLLGPDRLILIEAKLTSGNPLCLEGDDAEGYKPTTRGGLIQRYIAGNKLWQPLLCENDVSEERVHSQLLRMIIFASTMAQRLKIDWKLVNLVSRTQWAKVGTRRRKGYDFSDPGAFIPIKVRDHFQFSSWEELYRGILSKDARTTEIAEYMLNKTVNLSKAFEL